MLQQSLPAVFPDTVHCSQVALIEACVQDWQFEQTYYFVTIDEQKEALLRLTGHLKHILRISQDADLITGKELQGILKQRGLVSELRRSYICKMIGAERVFYKETLVCIQSVIVPSMWVPFPMNRLSEK